MNFANANQFHRKSGDHYPRTQTYRRNPKSSPDRMQPTPSFMDHLLWSSLLVLLPAYLQKGRPLLVFQQALGIHPLEKKRSPA
jgi:hypothetical protein